MTQNVDCLDALAEALQDAIPAKDVQIVKKGDITSMTLTSRAFAVLKENLYVIERGSDVFLDTVVEQAESHFSQYKATFGVMPEIYSIPELEYLEYAALDDKGGYTLAWSIQNFANFTEARMLISTLRKRTYQSHLLADDKDYWEKYLKSESKDGDLINLFGFVETYGEEALHFDVKLDDEDFVSKTLFNFITPYIYVPA